MHMHNVCTACFLEEFVLWSLVIFCSMYRYVIDTYIGVLAEEFFAHSHVYKGTRVEISIITGSVSREWAVQTVDCRTYSV